MINNESIKDHFTQGVTAHIPSPKAGENVCDLKNLYTMMGGKKHLIIGLMNTFLSQIREELQRINDAINKKDYPTIKKMAHTIKSSVSIMGISVLVPVLREMEYSGAIAASIEKIKEQNVTLNLICNQAIEEIEKEKLNYV